MGQYLNVIHDENGILVLRRYYSPSLREKTGGVPPKRKRTKRDSLEKKDSKNKSSKKTVKRPTTKKEIKDFQKNKLRKIRRLTETLNLNYSNKAFSVVLTIDEEHSKDMPTIESFKDETKKFFKRLNERVDGHVKYTFVTSSKEVVNSETGEIYDTRFHAHVLMESFSFEYQNGNILIHSPFMRDTTLQALWGKGIVFVKPVYKAIEDLSGKNLSGDQIKFLDESGWAADFNKIAYYMIEQAVETENEDNYCYKKVWASSLNLTKPDKRIVTPCEFDDPVEIPEGYELYSDISYGEVLKYREIRARKVEPSKNYK